MATRLRIFGRVQGVWYRGWTVEQARSLGLSGWVRNRADGSVEALLDGDTDKVARMVTLCRQGPPAANVNRVEMVTEDETVVPGFRQLPTL